MKRLKGFFTSSEVTAEAALDALSIANANGQDQVEIDRRATLIHGSKAIASANKKIEKQLNI
ncbi:MAG TPA: hypothetical protein VFI61_03055 [Patescibacteria group bacterium]|nr:hypothetical protein [Patescibacteria group bacterium]